MKIFTYVDSKNLLDLPEEVFGVIFRYIPNDQVVWSVGFTCQLLMEYALRFVWVIEDRIVDRDERKI